MKAGGWGEEEEKGGTGGTTLLYGVCESFLRYLATSTIAHFCIKKLVTIMVNRPLNNEGQELRFNDFYM